MCVCVCVCACVCARVCVCGEFGSGVGAAVVVAGTRLWHGNSVIGLKSNCPIGRWQTSPLDLPAVGP